jgi:hypothetical protein
MATSSQALCSGEGWTWGDSVGVSQGRKANLNFHLASPPWAFAQTVGAPCATLQGTGEQMLRLYVVSFFIMGIFRDRVS